MTKSRARLTELEGAILGVFRRAASCSAYRVRQVFLRSRSAEWSGSAGAVYPAIRRLRALGMLKQRSEKDGRGTKTYTLAAAGGAAHDEWLCDVGRALGPGMDPFRTRACLWPMLAPRKRTALYRKLQKEMAEQREKFLRPPPSQDGEDEVTLGLLVSLLELRRQWLDAAVR
ncbi:MAG TPA: helix-turn-helix transcriptional regulator [Rhizomicrobium sp.]